MDIDAQESVNLNVKRSNTGTMMYGAGASQFYAKVFTFFAHCLFISIDSLVYLHLIFLQSAYDVHQCSW